MRRRGIVHTIYLLQTKIIYEKKHIVVEREKVTFTVNFKFSNISPSILLYESLTTNLL